MALSDVPVRLNDQVRNVEGSISRRQMEPSGRPPLKGFTGALPNAIPSERQDCARASVRKDDHEEEFLRPPDFKRSDARFN